MKKYLQRLALLVVFTLGFLRLTPAIGQVALLPLYQYNRSTTPFTEITGGVVLGTTASDDQVFIDPAVPLGGFSGATGVGFPMGFDFVLNGVSYNRIAINNNGWIALGSSTLTPSVNTAGSSYTPLSSTSAITPAALAAKIAGFGIDLQGQAGPTGSPADSSTLRVETIGTAPNRVCVVQWKNYRPYNATGTNLNFQIRMEEGTNRVVFHYGTMSAGTGSYNGMVGLRAEPAATATNYISLTNSTAWASPSISTAASQTMTLSSAVLPASGSEYSFSPPAGTDLQAWTILSPVAPLSGGMSSPVTIRVRNTGANPITSATLTYEMGGGAPVTESWTGNITTGQTADHTFSANATIPSSNFSFSAWTGNVNGAGPDANANNDTVRQSYLLAIAGGTYIVGPSATANYPTVAAAVSAIRQAGITGSINFLIEPGTYFSPTGGYDLSSVVGSGGSTTIGFSSLTGSAADVILYNDTTGTPSSARHTFNISVPGVSFSSLTFARFNIGFSTSAALNFNTGAHNASVTGCVFNDLLGTSNSASNAVRLGDCNGVSIIGNQFNDFYYSIYQSGNTGSVGSAYSTGLQVISNTINRCRYYGIYLISVSNCLIQNNLLDQMHPTATFGYGIYFSRCYKATVSENTIQGLLPIYPIYFINYNGDPSNRNVVINNVISGTNLTASATHYPIFFSASFSATATAPANPRDYANVANNTVNYVVSSTSTTAYGLLHVSGSTTAATNGIIGVFNNIFYAKAGAGATLPTGIRGIYISAAQARDSIQSNYNNIRLEDNAGAPAARPLVGVTTTATTNYSTLAAWTTASGRDANSVSISPNFASITNAIPSAQSMDNLGTPLAYVTIDRSGASRNAVTPDLGAFEFTPSSTDLSLASVNASASCPAAGQPLTATIRNVGASAFDFSLDPATVSVSVSGPIPQTFSVTINSGVLDTASIMTVTVTNLLDLSIGGTYSLGANLSASTDGNVANNANTGTVVVQVANPSPYTQDFNTGTAIPAGFTTSMFLNSTAGVGQTPCLRGNVYGVNVANLDGPLVGPVAAGDAFRFEYKITDWPSTWPGTAVPMGAGDTIKIFMSGDCGISYTMVDFITSANHVTSNSFARYTVPVPSSMVGGFVKVRISFRQSSGLDVDFDVDNFQIVQPPAVDMGVVAITSPNDGCGLSASSVVGVRVRNFGAAAQSNVPVFYSINGGTAVNEVIPGPVNPGDTLTYYFATTANLAVAGPYNFAAATGSAGDADPSNDGTNRLVSSYLLVSQFPYSQDFENGPAGWTIGGSNPSWALGAPTGTVINSAGGGVASWVTNLSGNYNANEVSYIQSPCLSFASVFNAVLNMKVWWHGEAGWDGGQVQYSLDGGNTWTVLGDGSSGLFNWYNDTLTFGPGVGRTVWTGNLATSNPPTSGGWVNARHSLAALNFQPSVLLRVAYYSDGSVQYEGLGVDDISIDLPPAVDMGVIAVTAPVSGCVLGTQEQVTVRLSNFGSASQSNFPVSYSVNGATPVVETYVGTVNPGDTVQFTFATRADLSLPGSYVVRGATALSNDAFPVNDGRNITAVNTFPNLVPIIANLNSGFPTFLQPSPATNMTSAAAGVGQSGNLRYNVFSTLVANLNTKLVGPLQAGHNLEFDYKITEWPSAWPGIPSLLGAGDTIKVFVSNTCGQSYQLVDTIHAGNHIPDTNYRTRTVSLASFVGQSIYVRIVFAQSSGIDVYFDIDNFKIWNPLSPRILSISQSTATCTPTNHDVEAQILIAPLGASLTQVNLQYDLTGLGYSSTPMTYNAANDRWVGTVPAGSINVPVRYRVTSLDASSLVDTSLPRTYTDNYLTVFAGNDTTVTPGDTATLSASTTGFASSSMLRASIDGGNGSGGVTFNLRARNAITVDSILVPISGSAATTVDVWYSTSPINGAPTVAAPAWTQIVSGYSVTANNPSLTPTNLVGVPLPANFSIPSGAVYGFFVGCNGTMIYTTFASQVDTFVDPNMVIYTGPNVGYGGSAPNPTFSTRQFCGAVSVRNPAAVSWMVQGTSTVLSTGPVFRVAPNATTTYVAMITDSVCTTTDAVTVFTTGQNQVTGTFKYNNTPQTPMTNSTVQCRDANNVVLMTAQTDATGAYSMSGMTNGTYTVTGVTSKPWGGVNSVDALGIARSFTGAAPLVGLRVKAADVNGSNTINSLDALTTSRRFSGSIASFTVGNWAYEAVPTTVAGGVTTRNIMALAYGDVNGSYQPNTALRLDPRMVAFNQGYMTASDLTILPVRIDRALSLGALSVVVELPAGVRAEAVRSALIKGDFDFHQNGNELRVSWFSVDGVELSENDLLFSMELSGVSSLNADELHFGELSEAASPLAEVYPLVGLRMPRVSGAGQEVSLYPNPARDLSQIRVRLNSTADVSVRVLDARGRQVADFSRRLEAGTQVLDLVTEGWSEGQYRVEISVLEGKEVRQHGFRLQVRK
jgi:parallel beta-helix repeat protein